MIQLLGVDGLDLVNVEIELGRFSRDSTRDSLQLGMATTNNCAGTSALWRTVILSQTSFIIASCEKKM